MKKLIFGLVFLLGIAGIAKAEDLGEGYVATTVTGTHKVIFAGHGYVRGITLSSGATASIGDYALAITTAPVAAFNGADGTLTGGALFLSTAQIIPALVYKTTTTLSQNGDSLNNSWKMGDCAACYIETDGLTIRQSAASTGEANKVTVYWRR